MSKVRVYEVAKQLNLEPKTVVALFQTLGVADVRNHMSSVDADAIDRIKRHLDKQKTHDVVEERIRPTVVKRRAVAKPGDPDGNGAPSVTDLSRVAQDVASTRSVAALVEEAHVEKPSTRRLPVERKSAAKLEIEPAKESQPKLSPPPAHESAPVMEAAPPAVVEHEVPAAPPVPTFDADGPDTEEMSEPVPDSVSPSAMSTTSEVMAKPAAPKTGVEYWTGRPGVPMPAPAAQRPGAPGIAPRRVQYDPRSGTSSNVRPGGGSARPMGGPGGFRPGMMGRGGQMGRRSFPPGAQGMPRRVPQSTMQEMSAHKKVIRIEENITLQVMAQKLSMKATELMMKLISMGMTGIHINTSLDADTAKILAGEFGWEVEDVAMSEEATIAAARGEEAAAVVAEEGLESRPPVVTVMGHVDHGKTSLLDKIRKANVAGGEAGGITQHIGAYKVQTPKGTIVFLDTPGHEAFTQMRARGAGVTDIVILVVAADDGVMPQTKEAVNHAKSAKVPIIVAVNKMDKPSAEPERVRRELVELGLQPEEWGGDTIFVDVSAQTGAGIDTLLEMVSLQSEVLDLKANPKKAASGTVLEALLDRGRGPVARVLVQEGTLRVGDFVLAGAGFGKVRAMTNEHGKAVHEAAPSTPVEILGLSDVPGAGDPMHAVKDAKKALEIAEQRKTKMAKSLVPATAKVSLEELSRRVAESGLLELRVIVKGDVQGSVEAVCDALSKLSGDKVKLSIVHAGVGAITEGDVNLAIASRSVVIGFNVRPAGKAGALAEENKIEIRLYSIIYQAVDDVQSAMEGLLPAHLVEKVTGRAELRQLFKIKGTVIAGSYITQGLVKRSAFIRLIRDGVVLHTGKLDALKRFKEDVKEVAEGFECGISLDGWNDLKEGDILECFEMEEVKQKL